MRNHIRTLSLFGSVLTDHFRPDSDIDILVAFRPGHVPSLLGIAGMEIELSELLGRKVDLRTAEELSRYFRDEVVVGSVVVSQETEIRGRQHRASLEYRRHGPSRACRTDRVIARR